jgi:hypothetical protein
VDRSRQVFEVPRTHLTQELARRGLLKRGVEVGVAQGYFSEFILQTWPGSLWMVDRWESNPDYDEDYDQEENYRLALQVERHYVPRAHIVRKSSLEAVKDFPDGLLDFVYLDANHRYEEVLKDLTAWFPKVKRGGIFAGDDYGCLDEMPVDFGHGQLSFGVKRAVDEWALFEKRSISINWLAQWECRLIDPRDNEVFEVPARNWWMVK